MAIYTKFSIPSRKMGLIEFQHLLASKKIPIHYSTDDLKHDYETLKEMELL